MHACHWGSRRCQISVQWHPVCSPFGHSWTLSRDEWQSEAWDFAGVKWCMCGAQYTLILHASKAMPKQCVDYLTGKSKPRKTVGVRMPGDALCQVPPPSPAPLTLSLAVFTLPLIVRLFAAPTCSETLAEKLLSTLHGLQIGLT